MTATQLLKNQFSRIFLTALLTIVSASAANAQASAREWNRAEDWILKMVASGEIADLEAALNPDQTKIFPEGKDRTIGAQFLGDLITHKLPNVTPHRKGVRISGAVIEEPIDLENAQVPNEVWLEKCRFSKEANFAGATFGGTVSFQGSWFEAAAKFYNVKVGEDADFQGTVFRGQANFASASIKSTLNARGAQFENKEQAANFDSIKVGHSAILKHAVFEGPVNFVLACITNNLDADGVQFKNKQMAANFNAVRVGQSIFCRNAIFEGPVNFALASIGTNFYANAAEFRKKELDAPPEVRVPPTPAADFNSMKVGEMLLLKDAIFKGTTSFNGVKVSSASFENAEFEGPLDVRYANFTWLDVSWRNIPPSFDMQGMTYQYVRAFKDDDHKSHKKLLELAEHSPYTADVYSKLESFLLKQGYRGAADQVFIAGKQRERKHLDGWSRLGSSLLHLIGYGRYPSRAAYLCAFIIGFGAALFSPNKMELQKIDTTPRIYNRFWYSLGLFLPIVNLESDKVWKPKPNHTFLRTYMRVHILLGWILVPLFLAALNGLIK